MKLDDSVDSAVVLSQLALDIAGQPHPADAIPRVIQLAAKLFDCTAADLVRITDGGHLQIMASSDPDLSELTAKVWRRWPHRTIDRDGVGEDPATMVQRAQYIQQLRDDTGILQELILPLAVGQTDHGYLRLLLSRPLAAAASPALMRAFCAHAAIALDRAALLTQVANLRVALDTNREIGAAVGVVMTRHGLTYPEGLSRLTAASQNANRKLGDVAAEVVQTGDLPDSARSKVRR